MKILHSADWHLDSPLQGHPPARTELLKNALLSIPERLAALCKAEACDLVLLAGDLFDGAYTQSTFRKVYRALQEMAVPVFIAPGNHDFAAGESPYLQEIWPANVHIFTAPQITAYPLPRLDATVYGAGYVGMDCPALLEGFTATGDTQFHIGILHGDPATRSSHYCPITQKQVADSALHYLALGHIHKGGSFVSGNTLCAWPGCPMGTGYDETGEKGAYIVELTDKANLKFIPLPTPKFYDLEAEVITDAPTALQDALPPVGNEDCYRVTLTGHSDPVDIPALLAAFSHFPNLELRDNTLPPVDIWKDLGEDSFAGMYFGLLKEALQNATEEDRRQILLAARLSRQILDGEEVTVQ